MQLKDILDICRANEVEHFEYTVVNGDINTTVTGIASDSRKVTDGGIFVCIVGSVSDGHKYIEQVKDKASVIVVQKGSQYNTEKIPAAVIECDNTRLALALMSAAFYGNPDKKLFTIGITGTKGKTTTTYMIKNVLCACGIKTGLIGTIETVIGDELDRTAGIVFDIGVFTNLEPDHIGPNEHASFEEYLECKAKLFKQCKTGIVNADDKHTADILRDSVCSVEKYGISEDADIKASDIKLFHERGKIGLTYKCSGLVNMDVELSLPGMFSVYNSLCAIAVTRHFNVDNAIVENVLKDVKVKGRIELVPVSDKFTLMIDYAHNAMSLESILKTLKEYNPHRLADLTIITSDNPRFEEPLAIMEDIKTGINRTTGKHIDIADRKEAIKYAIENGEPGDIIVLAGKGHEDYQEIKGVKYPMDERVLISEVLEELKEKNVR